jgi:hypothetical protein
MFVGSDPRRLGVRWWNAPLMRTNMKKNLILSVVHTMPFAAVEPFVVSLKRTGYTGDVVIFVSRVSRDAARGLKQNGIRVIPFQLLTVRMRQPIALLWPVWRRWLNSNRDFEWKCGLARRVLSLVFLRFVLFHDFLIAEGEAYDHVMLTDCRDVIFQRDPFTLKPDRALWAFLEAESQTIGQCPFNRRMLQDCFGPAILAELSRERVSCSGVTIGDTHSMLAYLRVFVEHSFTIQKMPMVSGNDQGLHNYLVYRGNLPGLRLLTNADGIVATLGAVPRAQIHTNTAGEVTTSDGRVFPIVHQYDRHHDLRDALWKKLRE